MATLASSPPNGYLSGAAARRLLGDVAASTLQVLALRGEVRTLVLPGRPVAYERASVERLASARQQPARVGG